MLSWGKHRRKYHKDRYLPIKTKHYEYFFSVMLKIVLFLLRINELWISPYVVIVMSKYDEKC